MILTTKYLLWCSLEVSQRDVFKEYPQYVVYQGLSFFYSLFSVVVFIDILRVNEKLPASKLRYFGKYIIQLYGYFYVHVSGQ